MRSCRVKKDFIDTFALHASLTLEDLAEKIGVDVRCISGTRDNYKKTRKRLLKFFARHSYKFEDIFVEEKINV